MKVYPCQMIWRTENTEYMKQRRIALFAGLSFLVFLGYSLYMRVGLERLARGQEWMMSLIFTGIFSVSLLLAVKLACRTRREMVQTGMVIFLSLTARLVMLDFVSSDYTSFLSLWTEIFRKEGFRALGENIGDYNLLYQYALLMIAKGPLPDLYMIKVFSLVFDYALALTVMQLAGLFGGEKAKLPALYVLLLLPTVLLDGACWGQCDSVYAFLIMLSLYLLKTEHPVGAASALSLAFAFKLQTIFFFPVVLLALFTGEYRLRHALAFAAAYLVTLIPALMAGRPFMDALSVYANQSMGQYYHRLTYNAPSLYTFFPMLHIASTQEFTWMRYIGEINRDGTNEYLTEALFPTLQNAALLASVLLVGILVVYWVVHRDRIRREDTLNFALFCAILLPFVMPKIHDRYFYLADILSVLYALQRRDRRFVPVLVVTASLMSYTTFLMRQRPFDERVLSLMMGTALVVCGRDLLLTMRARAGRVEA